MRGEGVDAAGGAAEAATWAARAGRGAPRPTMGAPLGFWSYARYQLVLWWRIDRNREKNQPTFMKTITTIAKTFLIIFSVISVLYLWLYIPYSDPPVSLKELFASEIILIYVMLLILFPILLFLILITTTQAHPSDQEHLLQAPVEAPYMVRFRFLLVGLLWILLAIILGPGFSLLTRDYLEGAWEFGFRVSLSLMVCISVFGGIMQYVEWRFRDEQNWGWPVRLRWGWKRNLTTSFFYLSFLFSVVTFLVIIQYYFLVIDQSNFQVLLINVALMFFSILLWLYLYSRPWHLYEGRGLLSLRLHEREIPRDNSTLSARAGYWWYHRWQLGYGEGPRALEAVSLLLTNRIGSGRYFIYFVGLTLLLPMLFFSAYYQILEALIHFISFYLLLIWSLSFLSAIQVGIFPIGLNQLWLVRTLPLEADLTIRISVRNQLFSSLKIWWKISIIAFGPVYWQFGLPTVLMVGIMTLALQWFITIGMHGIPLWCSAKIGTDKEKKFLIFSRLIIGCYGFLIILLALGVNYLYINLPNTWAPYLSWMIPLAIVAAPFYWLQRRLPRLWAEWEAGGE